MTTLNAVDQTLLQFWQRLFINRYLVAFKYDRLKSSVNQGVNKFKLIKQFFFYNLESKNIYVHILLCSYICSHLSQKYVREKLMFRKKSSVCSEAKKEMI